MRAVDVWRERTQLVSIWAMVLIGVGLFMRGTVGLVLGGLAVLCGFGALACMVRWRNALVAEQNEA